METVDSLRNLAIVEPDKEVSEPIDEAVSEMEGEPRDEEPIDKAVSGIDGVVVEEVEPWDEEVIEGIREEVIEVEPEVTPVVLVKTPVEEDVKKEDQIFGRSIAPELGAAEEIIGSSDEVEVPFDAKKQLDEKSQIHIDTLQTVAAVPKVAGVEEKTHDRDIHPVLNEVSKGREIVEDELLVTPTDKVLKTPEERVGEVDVAIKGALNMMAEQRMEIQELMKKNYELELESRELRWREITDTVGQLLTKSADEWDDVVCSQLVAEAEVQARREAEEDAFVALNELQEEFLQERSRILSDIADLQGRSYAADQVKPVRTLCPNFCSPALCCELLGNRRVG